jgi:hypothetical protein
MNQNKNNAQTEKTTVQKFASVVSWLMVAAIFWYWLSPSATTPIEPALTDAAKQPQTPTIYTEASPQALASATQYLADLDDAMSQGLLILKANDLKDLSTHSQHFKILRETGQAQFGRSVFEPLGHCASAGIFANSWWQAQVSATRKGGEADPTAANAHLDQYRVNRSECLNLSDPAKEAVSA